ncbi:MAG TPA: ABC transporter ATP-binding protein, partial [Anaerolineaceae bacterium]
MGFHGGGWWHYLSATEEKPKITRKLLRRVLAYSGPYRWQLIGMLTFILLNTGLTLISPLILRDLIDRTIPSGNVQRLVLLALALLVIPIAGGVINVIGRKWNATVGEGVIYDLRAALYSHLQRMSLRFFTNTRVGELMSRLNNDVVGAQNAVSTSLISMITNIVQASAVLVVMLTLEWRLTILSVLILPLFILVARRMADRLRTVADRQLEANAQMNAMMNETLNIGGALLVKLFGRRGVEEDRFSGRAAQVRDYGIQRAVMGSIFFMIIGLLSAIGTALVYGLGGYLAIQHVFTVGTIVAFGAYLTSLYSSLQGLANAPVDFATSLVSFERVFEVVDLPQDIVEEPGAADLTAVRGELVMDHVSFRYERGSQGLLNGVNRSWDMDHVETALSGKADGEEEQPALEEAQVITQARASALDDVSFTV